MSPSSYIVLSYWDLVMAASLILINGVLSVVFRLGIERTLIIAAAGKAIYGATLAADFIG